MTMTKKVKALQARGLKQKEIAELLGCSPPPSLVSMILAGYNPKGGDVCRRIELLHNFFMKRR